MKRSGKKRAFKFRLCVFFHGHVLSAVVARCIFLIALMKMIISMPHVQKKVKTLEIAMFVHTWGREECVKSGYLWILKVDPIVAFCPSRMLYQIDSAVHTTVSGTWLYSADYDVFKLNMVYSWLLYEAVVLWYDLSVHYFRHLIVFLKRESPRFRLIETKALVVHLIAFDTLTIWRWNFCSQQLKWII